MLNVLLYFRNNPEIMKNVLIAIILTAIIVGGGVYWLQSSQIEDLQMKLDEAEEEIEENEQAERDAEREVEPLSYSITDETLEVAVTVEDSYLVNEFFTAEGLYSLAQECGSEEELEHFEDLMYEIDDETLFQYNFEYLGESQGAYGYTLSVMRNVPGYEDYSEFSDDFNICAVGGRLYPLEANDDWLLFGGSCGSGYDDGSGLPHGCDLIRESLVYSFN